MLLDARLHLCEGEAGNGWGGDLLYSGALSERHVSRPDAPDTVVDDEDCPTVVPGSSMLKNHLEYTI